MKERESPRIQKTIRFTPEQWEKIEDYRYANRIPSILKAVTRVIDAGIEKLTEQG